MIKLGITGSMASGKTTAAKEILPSLEPTGKVIVKVT